jgi:hypothetical protein
VSGYRSVSLGLLVVTACVLPAGADGPPVPAGGLPGGIASVAEKLERVLKAEGETAVDVGPFHGPPLASSGPGVGKLLVDELARRKVAVKSGARLAVQGRFQVEPDEKTQLLRVRLTVEVVARTGKVVQSFSHPVHFTADDTAGADVDGSAALASLTGPTAELPPDQSQKKRHKLLLDRIEAPKCVLRGTRVAAGETSPYAVEVAVAGKARQPVVRDGTAGVEIRRGEAYEVRLVNGSPQDAAVTLTIDGLSVFAFGPKARYTHLIVPAGSTGAVRGWYRTDEESESFLVTEYAKSAAAQLPARPGDVGTITASFAAAWPKADRQPDDEPFFVKRGDGEATGRGPVVRQRYEEVERNIGLVRAVVSVRYTRRD